MSKDDDGYAGKDRRYANLDEAHIPLTEYSRILLPVSFHFGKRPLLPDRWKKCADCGSWKFSAGINKIFR